MSRGNRGAPMSLFPSRVLKEQARAKVEDSGSGSGATVRRTEDDAVVGYLIPTIDNAAGRTVRTHEATHGRLVPWKEPRREGYHPAVAQIVEDMRVQMEFPEDVNVLRDAKSATLREVRVIREWMQSPEGEAALKSGTVPWTLVAALARDAAAGKRLREYYERRGYGIRSKQQVETPNLPDLREVQNQIRDALHYVQSARDWERSSSVRGERTDALREASGRIQGLLSPLDPDAEEMEQEDDTGAGKAPGTGTPSPTGDPVPDDGGEPGVGSSTEHKEFVETGKVAKDASTKEKAKSDESRSDQAMVDEIDMKYTELAPRVRPTKHARGPSWNPAEAGPRLRMALASRALGGGRSYGFFRRRKVQHERIGTVLIDASGSMGVTQENLTELMEFAPGATIAFYSGSDGWSGAELAVWAKAGKQYSGAEKLPLHGGNTGDLPALLWLLKQEGPRVFVTDGGFTGGPFGAAARTHTLLARAELRRQVTVIPSLAEARARFEEMERTGKRIEETKPLAAEGHGRYR